jgi:hypothetical protein
MSKVITTQLNMSNDYFKAQGWFKNYALNSQDSRGMFQRLVKEDEEAFKLASAETDKIKNMINKKYGPGSVKYGSEIPQPSQRPDVIEIDALNAFMKRNPAAEGGRIPFGKGSDVTYKGKYEADRYNTVKDIDSLKLNKEKINLKASNFKTGEILYPDDKGQKYVQQYLDNVEKGYLNNDMSKVERFKTFIKNKYPKTFDKVIADVNMSGYRGMMDIGFDYKRKLANEIITASNNQLKYINKFDIIKKLIPANRAAQVKDGGINSLGNLLDENTLNAFSKLDKMEDKLSKSLTYIVDNNVEILDPSKIKIKGSAAADYQTQSPIKKMMNYLAGGGSRKQLNKALEQNKWYQSQNYKVGKTIRNTFDDLSQAYSTDFIGQNFNDAYDYALNRRGSVSVKGMTKAITPERLIWNFAARSADRHFKDLDNPKDWLVKIVDNKGNPIDYSSLPVDDKGRRIIDTNKYQFLYDGQTFNKNNLNTKGYQSGLFNDVYKATNQITNYLNTDVPDPDNPKKTISLGELFEKTDGRIFASIGHDDAKGGVKKKPFNTFKILTNVENQALFNAYDKIKSPAVRKQVVNFIYGDTKGLRGEKYKEAWVKKNVPFITEYIKTGKGLEETPYKQKLKEIDYIDGKGGTTLSSGFNTDLLMKDPAVQKILNSKAGQAVKNAARGTAGTVGKVFGVADILLGVLDYENNISKGQKPDEALGNAVQAMSFGLYKSGDKARIEDVKERFVAKGGDGEIFDQATALNAKDQEINDLIYKSKFTADKAFMDLSQPQAILGKSVDQRKQDYDILKKELNEKIRDKISERDGMIKSYKTNLQVTEAGAPIQIGGQEFFSQPFKDIKRSTMEKIEEENKEAYDMQKRQLVPTAGNIGNWLLNNVFTMNPQERAQMQKYINEMDEKELYKFNLERGMDPDNLIRFEDILRYKTNDPALMGVNTTKYINKRDQKSEGGITGLRSKYEYKK